MSLNNLRRTEDDLVRLYDPEDIFREVELEERMVSIGRDQIAKQIARAKEKGNESGTGYGKTLIAMSVERLGTAITAFIAKAETGGAGRRHIAVKYLKQLDAEVAAFIAMRCIVDSLTGKRQVLQRAAIVIGSRIEDEVRFASFSEENGKLFDKAQGRAKKATAYHRKKATLAGYERRFSEDEWVSWPEQDRLHIGALLIDMIVEAGLVEIGDVVRSKVKTDKVITPTEKLVTWIEREAERSALLSPAHMPMRKSGGGTPPRRGSSASPLFPVEGNP